MQAENRPLMTSFSSPPPPPLFFFFFFTPLLLLSPPCAHRTLSQASPLFLSLSSSSSSHHSLFLSSLPRCLSQPPLPRSSFAFFFFFKCAPLLPLSSSPSASCIFFPTCLSFHPTRFAPVSHHPSLTPSLSFTLSLAPHRCTLPACLPACLPVCLFHKGLSEASALLIHSLCIASHICRVRQTDREGERERGEEEEEEEIWWKREGEGPRKEDMEGKKKKRCSFISKKQKARARSCGGVFHNLVYSSLP